jgi:hypothetical protein
MGLSDYFTRAPKDALDQVLQDEVAGLAELLSDDGRRRVFVMVSLLHDGEPRACVLSSVLDNEERKAVGGELLVEIAEHFDLK